MQYAQSSQYLSLLSLLKNSKTGPCWGINRNRCSLFTRKLLRPGQMVINKSYYLNASPQITSFGGYKTISSAHFFNNTRLPARLFNDLSELNKQTNEHFYTALIRTPLCGELFFSDFWGLSKILGIAELSLIDGAPATLAFNKLLTFFMRTAYSLGSLWSSNYANYLYYKNYFSGFFLLNSLKHAFLYKKIYLKKS